MQEITCARIYSRKTLSMTFTLQVAKICEDCSAQRERSSLSAPTTLSVCTTPSPRLQLSPSHEGFRGKSVGMGLETAEISGQLGADLVALCRLEKGLILSRAGQRPDAHQKPLLAGADSRNLPTSGNIHVPLGQVGVCAPGAPSHPMPPDACTGWESPFA